MTLSLIENGGTDYKIVYDGGNGGDAFAVSEFVAFFEESTGIRPTTETFSGVPAEPGEKRIVIGRAPAAAQGLTADNLRSESGYKITVTENAVFVYGKTDYGSIFGVYDLLGQLFGLRFYTWDVYDLDDNTGVQTLTIKAESRAEELSVGYLCAAYGEMQPHINEEYGWQYACRLGYAVRYYVSLDEAHNALKLVSYEEYAAAHPEWFYEGTIAITAKEKTEEQAPDGSGVYRMEASYGDYAFAFSPDTDDEPRFYVKSLNVSEPFFAVRGGSDSAPVKEYGKWTEVRFEYSSGFLGIGKGWSVYIDGEKQFGGIGDFSDFRLCLSGDVCLSDVTDAAGGAAICTADGVVAEQNDGGSGQTGRQLVLAAEDFRSGEGTLVRLVADKIYGEYFSRDDMNRLVYGFSPMDIDIWPTGEGYEKSDALLQKYGTYSAEYILFMNEVAKVLESRLAAEGFSGTVCLQLLAYNKTLCAPDLSRPGLTQADRDAVKLYDGDLVRCAVTVAPIECNLALSFSDPDNRVKNPVSGAIDGGSPTVAGVILGWRALTDEVSLWLYSFDVTDYFMPLNTFDALAENYRFAAENGVRMLYSQSMGDTPVAPDWSRLKMFLQAELAKDPYADAERLTEEFLSAYFGAGAEAMSALLGEERAWLQSVYETNRKAGTIRGAAYSAGERFAVLWDDSLSGGADESMLLRWMGYIDEALAAVAESPDAETLKNRILLESLTIRHLLLKVYGCTRYDESEEAFYAAARALGVTKLGEGQDIPA